MNRQLWILCASDDPHKAHAAFMLAASALATDMPVTLFFTMHGMNIITKGGADKITLPNAPNSLPELLALVRDLGVRMIACTAALPIMEINEDDLIDGVAFEGMTAFVAGPSETDIVMTFA